MMNSIYILNIVQMYKIIIVQFDIFRLLNNDYIIDHETTHTTILPSRDTMHAHIISILR